MKNVPILIILLLSGCMLESNSDRKQFYQNHFVHDSIGFSVVFLYSQDEKNILSPILIHQSTENFEKAPVVYIDFGGEIFIKHKKDLYQFNEDVVYFDIKEERFFSVRTERKPIDALGPRASKFFMPMLDKIQSGEGLHPLQIPDE